MIVATPTPKKDPWRIWGDLQRFGTISDRLLFVIMAAQVNDDGSGGMTLHDLAAVYGVSAERIRQIEVAAMKKMKKALAEYA